MIQEHAQSEQVTYEAPAVVYEAAIEVRAYNPPLEDLSKLLEP